MTGDSGVAFTSANTGTFRGSASLLTAAGVVSLTVGLETDSVVDVERGAAIAQRFKE